jgi:hypothetical protein
LRYSCFHRKRDGSGTIQSAIGQLDTSRHRSVTTGMSGMPSSTRTPANALRRKARSNAACMSIVPEKLIEPSR